MERVLLLNADYQILNVIDWKRAICLMEKGKAEVIEYTDKVLSSASRNYKHPKVMRLLYFVKTIFKTHVPVSKKNIFFRDNYQCGYCLGHDGAAIYIDDKPVKLVMTIDHVIPKSRGGRLSFENAVTCCQICNAKKDDRTPNEARMKLRKRLYPPTIKEFMAKKYKNLSKHFSV